MVGWSPRQTAALALLLVALLAGGVLAIWRKGRAAEDEFVVVPRTASAAVPGAPQAAPAPAGPAQVVVHVAGAVRRPGVLRLASGARAEEAVTAAGGALDGADLDAINLAARVEDGEQLYVPRKGERTGGAAHPSAGTAAPASSAGSPPGGHAGRKKLAKPGEGWVNLNSASAEELQKLPGVGPAMAARILEFRATNGRFTSPEQLMDVSGIGPKKFDKMKGFVRVK